MNPWLEAARPKTLPAAVVPVALGTALAARNDQFDFVPAVICLLFALLIQIGTNFANDYYDHRKGADTADRIGPARAVASGWVRPRTMLIATIVTFFFALLFGSLLIPYGGYGLIAVGLLAVVCGIAYTGGPYPLGYNGLGEVFVFLFFGFVATGFTYYVQTGHWTADVWWLGCIPGALASNLLVINNLRDIPTDRVANKRTLAVRFGFRLGVVQFAAQSAIAFVATLILALRQESVVVVLPWIFVAWALLLGIRIARAQNRDAERWQAILGSTARLLLAYGTLQAAALLLA